MTKRALLKLPDALAQKTDGFRFSYDKNSRLFRTPQQFSFDDFVEIGSHLESIVRGFRPSTTAKVITCEDAVSYNAAHISNSTFVDGSILDTLQSRPQYELHKFDQDAWKHAMEAQLTIRDPRSRDTFMICFTHDGAQPHRLFFYGQSLDEETYKAVMERFHKEGSNYILGNGF